MDATLSTAALASAEAAINAALAYDPGTRFALGKLSGQVLAISVTTPAITAYFVPEPDRVRLLGHWEGEVNTRLQGSLPALIRLATGDPATLKDSGVEVTGSTGFLLELQRILRRLDIDWEEALSQLLGDIAGHQSASMMRSGARWLRERGASGQRLVSEFITEELKALPTKNELTDFYRAVDALRLDTDRAEARLQQLIKQLQQRRANTQTKD
jgi:ubiquinone biosynthesis protein UbiJ